MEYAVPENDRPEAEDLLEIYRDDRIGLALLQEFYNHLPEAREDWIREIRVVNRQRGIFLLAAITAQEKYLYLVSSEGLEFQGSMADGYLAEELLDFFGYDSAEAFKAICASPETLPIYEPLQMDEEICPACHAVAGEFMSWGVRWNSAPGVADSLFIATAAMKSLGLDSIGSEAELLQFEALLEERGRIPYSQEQRPSFAEDGSGDCFRVKVKLTCRGRISGRSVWVSLKEPGAYGLRLFFWRGKGRVDALSVTSAPSDFPGSGKDPNRRKAPAKCSC